MAYIDLRSYIIQTDRYITEIKLKEIVALT